MTTRSGKPALPDSNRIVRAGQGDAVPDPRGAPPLPEDCMTMADVRAGVDAMDAALAPLLAQRLRYMVAAARIKPDRAAVRDEARKQAVIAQACAHARAQGAPEAVIAQIYDALVEASIAYEFEVFDALASAAGQP